MSLTPNSSPSTPRRSSRTSNSIATPSTPATSLASPISDFDKDGFEIITDFQAAGNRDSISQTRSSTRNQAQQGSSLSLIQRLDLNEANRLRQEEDEQVELLQDLQSVSKGKVTKRNRSAANVEGDGASASKKVKGKRNGNGNGKKKEPSIWKRKPKWKWGKTRPGPPPVEEMVAAPSDVGEVDGRIPVQLMKFLTDLRDPNKNNHHWYDRNQWVWDFCFNRFLIFIDLFLANLRRHDRTLPNLIRYSEELSRPQHQINQNISVRKGIYKVEQSNKNRNPEMDEYRKDLSYGAVRGNMKDEDYAGYFLWIEPGGISHITAGFFRRGSSTTNTRPSYERAREGVAEIRRAVKNNTEDGMRLKEIVESEEFQTNFGRKPTYHDMARVRDGKEREGEELIENGRYNFWGDSSKITKDGQFVHEQYKKPQKVDGIETLEDDPDYQWFFLQHLYVGKAFTDEQVLAPDFLEQLTEAARQMVSLVQILNKIVHGPFREGED